jgi:hypothetical protein
MTLQPSGPQVGLGPQGVPPRVPWRPARLWAFAVAAAVVGGTIPCIAAWELANTFTVSARAAKMASGATPDFTLYAREKVGVSSRNAALANAIFGAVMGLALGLAGGLLSNSGRGRLVGPLAGLILGGVAGGAIPFLIVPIFHRNYDPTSQGLLLPTLVHGAIWGPVGVASGLAFGLGIGGRSAAIRGLLGGGIGILAGTVLFELVLAVALPFVRNDNALPTEPLPHGLAYGFASLSTAVGIALAFQLAGTRGATPGRGSDRNSPAPEAPS